MFSDAVCGGSPHEAIAHGVPLVVIGGMLAGGSMLIAKPEIGTRLKQDWKNFRGMRIGRPKGTILTSMIVASHLQRSGLDPQKDVVWKEYNRHEDVLEAITRVENLTGRRMSWRYAEQNRVGDHICYISDLRKLQTHFPGWRITRPLEGLLAEMVDRDGRLLVPGAGYADVTVTPSELAAVKSLPLDREGVMASMGVAPTVSDAQNRLGMAAVRAFQETIVPLVQVERVDFSIHRAGISALLTANRRQLSLVDCVSFEVMRSLGMTTALAFDPHFTEQGFLLL